MGRKNGFVQEILDGVANNIALEYGVSKATDILLDLEIEDEIIKQNLVKHFDILYKEAESILEEAKKQHNCNK